MSAATDADRGMRAVLRARAVRERDSRIGLQQALGVCRTHQETIDHLHGMLADTDGMFTDAGAYRTARTSLLWVGEAITSEQAKLESAQQVADVARDHWRADKVRLSAVENILERRAEERRVERAHRERTALDDVAGQLWIRARAASATAADTSPDLSPDLSLRTEEPTR
ncbi:flagellar FliJ family protein [Nocardioides yefusunii]|uniref:Flagellar FliJ protein n=1 Tax=Nocardioides yefusunii TaxID=2500546 RepID=A0ABW1QYJ1_9ACTN|nr:flagellar FliJ family protein [Nocardioides yefusunii]